MMRWCGEMWKKKAESVLMELARDKGGVVSRVEIA